MKILLIVVSSLFILGCSQEKQEKQMSEQNVQKQVVQQVKEQKVVSEAVKAPEQKEKKREDEVAKTPVVEVAKVKTEVVAKEVAVIEKAEVDGAKIFVKCAGCHGKNGEKKALGKSQVIEGWDETKVANAIHGYKDGSYGGAMKALMKGQVSNLSDDEVNAVAKYISKL